MQEQEAASKGNGKLGIQLIALTVLGMIPGSAVLLGLGWLPWWAEAIAAGYLWIFGLLLLLMYGFVFYLEIGIRAFDKGPTREPGPQRSSARFHEAGSPEAQQPSSFRQGLRHRLVRHGVRLALLGCLWALAMSGRPVLTGLYVLLTFVSIGIVGHIRRHTHGLEANEVGPARGGFRRALKVVGCGIQYLGRIVSTGFGWTFAAAIGALIWLWDYISQRRITRGLRDSFERPNGFVYFLSSEPHQRDHFLGETGVLEPFGDWVVSRDWRQDIKTIFSKLTEPDFWGTPEGRLLEYFKVSNLQEHLPFAVIVSSKGSLQPFHFNGAYRVRYRDNGEEFRVLEVELATAVARTLLARS